MSHVDEGALHAYLDGALEEYPTGEARRIRAHLERCERCAEALTEARRIRDRAESVLAAPALNVTPPPLEELKRIARSGEAKERMSRTWGRRQRFGWAASVVLALGIGWIVRGGMPLPTVGPDRAETVAESAVAEAPSASSADAGTPPALTRQLSENAVEAFEASAETVVAEALERSVPSSAPSEERAVMAKAPPVDVSPTEVPAPEPATPPTLQDVVVTGQAGRIDDDLDVPIVPTAFSSAAASPTAGLPAESAEVAVAAAGADTTRMTGVEEVGAEEREAAPRSEAARLSLASRSAAAGTALTRGVDRGVAGDEARGDSVSEPGSLVVPGLEVLSIVWREEGVVPAGVRVIQRLDEGQELELIHLPAGFDPSAVHPAEQGVSELVVPRDQGWLILRAPVEESELRLLLERMDAPDPDR
ncbi:MAG: zf-HC2 domain-containing protein [Gemmatimonadota bacterium]